MSNKPLMYGYCRVSTPRQQEHGLSLEDQVFQLNKAADAEPGVVFQARHIKAEAESAFKLPVLKRPVAAWIDSAMQKGDHLYVCKLDRIFRSMGETANMVERWQARGVIVHLLDVPQINDPLLGKLVLYLFGFCAEMESRRKSERMREAYATRRRMGLPPCGTVKYMWPFRWYGTKATPVMKVNATDRQLTSLVFDLYYKHDLGIADIERHLFYKKIRPWDRRPTWAQQKAPKKVAQQFFKHDIRAMIAVEAQLRFYEVTKGLTPDAAAQQWLIDWRQGTLPDDKAVREWAKQYWESLRYVEKDNSAG